MATAGTNKWDSTHKGTVDDLSDEQREVRHVFLRAPLLFRLPR
jgi:hypothetical protein